MQQKKKIVVIAPSSFVPIDAKVDEIVGKLEGQGYQVELDKERFQNYDKPYHETKDERLKHLLSVMKRDDVDIIWTLRGGYGLSHLMQKLQLEISALQHAKPKLLIGYSDTTLLGMYFNNCLGWKWLHAPGLMQFDREEKALTDLLPKVLNDDIQEWKLEVKGVNKLATSIKGKLIGGNLTLIQNSVHTYWEYDYRDKILFIEEVGEKPYRVDRMLHHLESSGIIKDLKGLLIADLYAPNDPQKKDMDAFVQAFAERVGEEYDLPVYSIEGIGHNAHNHPVLVGHEYQLEVV